MALFEAAAGADRHLPGGREDTAVRRWVLGKPEARLRLVEIEATKIDRRGAGV